MSILKKKWKQNKIEHALIVYENTKVQAAQTDWDFPGLVKFLVKYGIHDIQLVANIICNKFLIGTDKKGRRLFIKTGKHNGIYENEYKMGAELYNIDNEHFIQPLYFHDNDKFRFFANEYVTGQTLQTAIMTDSLTDAQRAKVIGDIWHIFRALRMSDVVHRDIRPDNLMLIDDRLVLIDFQLAVSKTNYQELEYMLDRPSRLRKLGHRHYRYRPFVWDDAHSLLKVMEFVGRRPCYAKRYDVIYKHIKSYVGTARIKSSVRENGFHRLIRHIRKMQI